MVYGEFIFLLIWAISSPFVYGLLLSRFFGLKKAIDHWILVLIHIVVTAFVVIPTISLYLYFLDTPLVVFGIDYIIYTVIEGFIWQFFLKDRKMNGFFISAVCNLLIFLIPSILFQAQF